MFSSQRDSAAHLNASEYSVNINIKEPLHLVVVYFRNPSWQSQACKSTSRSVLTAFAVVAVEVQDKKELGLLSISLNSTMCGQCTSECKPCVRYLLHLWGPSRNTYQRCTPGDRCGPQPSKWLTQQTERCPCWRHLADQFASLVGSALARVPTCMHVTV